MSVLNFATSPNSGVKFLGGVSEVGKNDFSLYFCWRCVVFLVLYYSSAAIARHIFQSASAILTDLIKKSTTWRWGPQEQQAFEELKHKVANAKYLGMPRV